MNMTNFILIILIMILFCILFFILKKEYFMDNVILSFALICPVLFSIFGIVFNEYSNESYLLPFVLFYVIFLVALSMVILNNKTSNKGNFINAINNTLDNNKKIFNILGMIAILLKLSLLVYPKFKLFELFTPWNLTYSFSANDYFGLRLFERSDLLSKILSISATALSPFFYILLYNKKDKPLKFSLIYIFYFYIDFVNENYIQRNKIIIVVVFLLFYLIFENIIKKRNLIFIIPTISILLIVATDFLFSYRVGIVKSNVTVNSSITSIILSESETQKYLDVSNELSKDISFPKMIASIVTAPFFFLPNIDFPILSYLFTERITGVEYGGTNYYILLPGFFEEAVIIFGKELAFIYGFFVALFTGIIYNFLKKINSASFFLLSVIINFAAACRGTLQSFMLQQVNLISSFLVIIILVTIIKKKGRTINE